MELFNPQTVVVIYPAEEGQRSQDRFQCFSTEISLVKLHHGAQGLHVNGHVIVLLLHIVLVAHLSVGGTLPG